MKIYIRNIYMDLFVHISFGFEWVQSVQSVSNSLQSVSNSLNIYFYDSLLSLCI